MIGELPTCINVCGKIYEIRTDFRDILRIILAFGDVELEEEHQAYICLKVLYIDFDNMPESAYGEAYEKAVQFIDCGKEPSENKKSPRTMDWEQDENIIFSAVNRVAGMEVRSASYMHWWTFMGFFSEIGECTFSQVQALRHKKATGKKLEKHERDYWSEHIDLCKLKEKLTEKERERKDALNAMLS